MDTRQIQTNTFTGGLNTDLHPLTTPNNIITDCINGTIITYNGNEFILQNDMGNYKLPLSLLPNNYIPMGIKEYNGIIYIVSYNPVEKLTQIGSYPFPQRTFNSKNSNDSTILDLGISPDTKNKYTSIVSKEVVQLYSADENFKLNPGDKYYITLKLDDSLFYQDLEFYVLTDERSLVKLNKGSENQISNTKGYVVTHETENDNVDKWDFVNWEISGWLAYKCRLAYLDQFNLVVVKFENSGIGKSSAAITVQGQTIVSDMLFLQKNSKLVNNLYIWLCHGKYIGSEKKYYDSVNKNWVNINDIYNDIKINYNKVSNSYSCNYGNVYSVKENVYTPINKFLSTNDIRIELDNFKDKDSENNYIYFIEAIPILLNIPIEDETTSENENLVGIWYNNFNTTIDINLDEYTSLNKITGFERYRYISDENGVTLEFNLSIPTINSSINDLNVKYSVYNILEPVSEEDVYSIEDLEKNGAISKVVDKTLTEINYLGQNIIYINGLSKENIYLFTLTIESTDDSITWVRYIITSDIFNQYYMDLNKTDFSKITLTEWLDKSKEFIKYPEISIQSEETTSPFIYRNQPDDTIEDKSKWQYVLESETKDGITGSQWRNFIYPLFVDNKNELNKGILPEIGVGQLLDIYLETKTGIYYPTLFNNKGIWSNINGNWSLYIDTNRKNNINLFENKKITNDIQQKLLIENNKDFFTLKKGVKIEANDVEIYNGVDREILYLYDLGFSREHEDREKRVSYNSLYNLNEVGEFGSGVNRYWKCAVSPTEMLWLVEWGDKDKADFYIKRCYFEQNIGITEYDDIPMLENYLPYVNQADWYLTTDKNYETVKNTGYYENYRNIKYAGNEFFDNANSMYVQSYFATGGRKWEFDQNTSNPVRKSYAAGLLMYAKLSSPLDTSPNDITTMILVPMHDNYIIRREEGADINTSVMPRQDRVTLWKLINQLYTHIYIITPNGEEFSKNFINFLRLYEDNSKETIKINKYKYDFQFNGIMWNGNNINNKNILENNINNLFNTISNNEKYNLSLDNLKPNLGHSYKDSKTLVLNTTLKSDSLLSDNISTGSIFTNYDNILSDARNLYSTLIQRKDSQKKDFDDMKYLGNEYKIKHDLRDPLYNNKNEYLPASTLDNELLASYDNFIDHLYVRETNVQTAMTGVSEYTVKLPIVVVKDNISGTEATKIKTVRKNDDEKASYNIHCGYCSLNDPSFKLPKSLDKLWEYTSAKFKKKLIKS